MRDLWTDFADESLLTEVIGQGGGLRQRRPNEQAVLAALRAWLLEEYMLPYGTSLGATRIFKRCYWIDGLGASRSPAQIMPPLSQDEIASTKPRSRRKSADAAPDLPPALSFAGATARQLAQLDRPIALQSFLLDEKSSKRRTARGEVTQPMDNTNGASAPLTLPKEGGLLPADWPELAPLLLNALEQSAAVFLLNPLQEGLFRYTDLAPLYQRTAPTELFLWLPHKRIATHLLPDLRTPTGAAALTNLLRGDRWKTLLARATEDGEEKTEQRIHRLVELLAESMRVHFLTVQCLNFPLRTGPALVEAAPYSLLFATRRQDSLACMNDAVCKRTRRLIAESQQGVLNEEWFTTQREEQATLRGEALFRETLVLGRAQRVRRWPDLRQQLLLAHFGQHTLQDYDQVITRLLESGNVYCEWRQAQKVEETSIPGSSDLLHWK
jgi:hypothetical protein